MRLLLRFTGSAIGDTEPLGVSRSGVSGSLSKWWMLIKRWSSIVLDDTGRRIRFH